MQWDFSPVWANWDFLALGFVNSLKVFIVSLIVGIPVGLALALMRLSHSRLLSWPALIVIEVMRSTPPIVTLFWVFFAAPLILGLKIGSFEASVVTLGIASAAFFAEIFRAGIVSVEKGLVEASRALAMSPMQSTRRVVLPIAVKRMVAAFFERSVELLKGTTLVSTVAYADLMYNATALVQETYRPLEIYSFIALFYFVFIYVASVITGRVEVYLARTGEAGGH